MKDRDQQLKGEAGIKALESSIDVAFRTQTTEEESLSDYNYITYDIKGNSDHIGFAGDKTGQPESQANSGRDRTRIKLHNGRTTLFSGSPTKRCQRKGTITMERLPKERKTEDCYEES
ncbi:hypothetical protein JTB14_038112 [Gonioctena quinquepunctata]|nr:hypothetical protein JTB14_038112 [Gonioctena quinquepunctata]